MSYHPLNWPISRKVAVGPLLIVFLLGLIIFFGWSIAERHQRQIGDNYREHAAYRETALRLPYALTRIQRDLYKLSIWAQLDVQGDELTSVKEAIRSDLADIGTMVEELEKNPASSDLKAVVQRYGKGVEQAMILISRSPAVGATATRGIEAIYREADRAANGLAKAAEELFDQRAEQARDSWRQLMLRFFLAIGAVVITVLVVSIGPARMIAMPIRDLADLVDRLRRDELDAQVPWTARGDEIGLLARAMESFRSNLIRNRQLERERKELNQHLERKVEERTRELAAQKERLAKALEKEHELNGLQRQFVSMVCHEFRTPLAIIDGNAQRIVKRLGRMSPDRIGDALGKVRTSVTRLTELMESVLSASRLEAGVIKMEPAPCDLAELITEVVSNYREVNPSHLITADVERLPQSFTVDAKLIRQVVSNLVSNAVKYSPDGARVHVKAEGSEDGGVHIAVNDQGVGIPAAELEQLFNRFFRASTSTGIAGTGIGLHMVKALVDMHHGRVDVSSEEGVGTTFRIYLPAHDDDRGPEGDGMVDAA